MSEFVAEFRKRPNGRLEMFSLTVVESRTTSDGRAYVYRTQYDVDRSRKYGYLYHQSGAGGGPLVEVTGVYFATSGAAIKEKPTTLIDGRDKPPYRSAATRLIRQRNKTRRLRRVPAHMKSEHGANLLAWLEHNAISAESVYCSKCRDDIPDTGYDWCEHVWWCDKNERHSTPDDRCACASSIECQSL